MRKRAWSAGIATLALVVAACGSDDEGSGATETTGEAAGTTIAPPPLDPSTTAAGGETTSGGSATGGECATVDDVSLQLQWFVQAQFAGYIAARDEGFYEARCLNVEILEGGVDIVPQQVLADGQADFAIAWVPKALQSREQGAEITNIAQIFQRSGTLQVSFKDAGITSPADFAGKTIGNWGFGNEYEIFAALTEAELDPASDVTLVQQQFDMIGLLAGDIDAAEAMIYNEYAQVLEAENPETGELYTTDDLNVVSYEEEGVGMLQDAVWADATRMEDATYSDIATRFLAASVEGWAYCRDNPEECRDLVVASGSQLGDSHQLWQMNEINKLIWPSPNGIGILDETAWERTVEIAQNTANLEGETVLTEPPSEGAYNMELMTAALELVGDGVDTTGEDFEPIEVTLEPGGA
ncbi:MAG: ABC transporter substrate-binding protein [Ilumatobacteraceae bacterium]